MRTIYEVWVDDASNGIFHSSLRAAKAEVAWWSERGTPATIERLHLTKKLRGPKLWCAIANGEGFVSKRVKVKI